MQTFLKFMIIFLALTGAATLLVGGNHATFGTIDFWDNHGVFFLFFITLFPRLTLLFSSVPFGGLLWWLGFFFAPRILVAVLASIAYWQTNPILVVIAWFVAISGETAEKWGFNQQFSVHVGGRSFGTRARDFRSPGQKINDNVVDAEFRRMDDE